MSTPRSVALFPVALLTLLLGACGHGDTTASTTPGGNPFAVKAQTVVANPLLVAKAKQDTADGDTEQAALLDRLAGVPTGIWLTPESYPVDQVGGYVSSVVQQAAGATVPVFVIYGIPDRDCTGSFSAGGLTPSTYLPWVQAIASAIGSAGVAVLEPDALPSASSCGHEQQRLSLMGRAVDALAAAHVTTYVDAGHSDWRSVPDMAALLKQVGVEKVRGFSTNVANYQPQSAEVQYATELSQRLDGAHYVIDSGRNGASDASGQPVSDWCNPSGQALGNAPGYVSDGTPLDALLWIKPPAESDGTCHGGPAAGDLWFSRAVSLAEAAGW